MRFGLITIFYATALTGAALGLFGAVGLVPAGLVLAVWARIFTSKTPGRTLRNFGCLFFIVLVLFLLVYPTVGVVRESARQQWCRSNLRTLAFALRAYEKQYGCFPPAYVADENGRPMHSWRTLILPFIEEITLHRKYDFSQPWDGPNNRALAVKTPWLWGTSCPNDDRTNVSYLAVVGADTMWPEGGRARRRTEIKDDLSATLWLVEVRGSGIHWMEPRDLTVEELIKARGGNADDDVPSTHHGEDTWSYYSGWNAAFADGEVAWLDEPLPAETLRAWSTVDGGEPCPRRRGHHARHLKWGRIYSLVAFLVLAPLPSVRLRQHFRETRAKLPTADEERTV